MRTTDGRDAERMMSDSEAFHRLQGLLEDLRTDWYSAGRGDEFEALIERYRADGIWPFD